MSDINSTLEERGTRYGVFAEHARITQNIKQAMYDSPNFGALAPDQVEALEMIAHKIGRILNGDPNYHDSWHDIIGYTKLVADRLETLTETFAPIGQIVPLVADEEEPEELKQFTLKEIDDLIRKLNAADAIMPTTDFGPMTEEEEDLRFDEVIQARQDIDQQALNNAYLEPIVRGDVGMAELDTYNGEHD